MARSRNIKPGLFHNEDLAELGPQAQLLFIGLWTLADREGKLDDRPRRIKAQLFPYYDSDCDSLLWELHRKEFITRYEVKNVKYIQVINFLSHQHPHKTERDSIIPSPDINGAVTVKAPLDNGSRPADSLFTDSLSTDSLTNPSVEQVRPDPDQVGEIFEHWRKTMNHPRARLDEKRRKVIRRALKDGYSVEDLKKAVTGCAQTPHNMGKNERGQRYDGLELILRNGDQIDRFMANAKSQESCGAVGAI